MVLHFSAPREDVQAVTNAGQGPFAVSCLLIRSPALSLVGDISSTGSAVLPGTSRTGMLLVHSLELLQPAVSLASSRTWAGAAPFTSSLAGGGEWMRACEKGIPELRCGICSKGIFIPTARTLMPSYTSCNLAPNGVS